MIDFFGDVLFATPQLPEVHSKRTDPKSSPVGEEAEEEGIEGFLLWEVELLLAFESDL